MAQQVPDNYTNHVEMFQRGDGENSAFLWNVPGEVLAQEKDFAVSQAVPQGGAVFVLSTVRSQPFQGWTLDQATIGTYEANISIVTHETSSEDENVESVLNVPRTRADQPFIVSVDYGLPVQGAVTNELSDVIGVPEFQFELYSQDYPDGENSFPGGSISVGPREVLTYTGLGTHPENVAERVFFSSLGGSDPFSAAGEEHFVVRASGLGTGVDSILDQAHLKVFPVWTGEQSGLIVPDFIEYDYSEDSVPVLPAPRETPFEVDESFEPGPNVISYTQPPEVTFSWFDLYPVGSVGLIVNDANIPHPWGGRWVVGSQKTFTRENSHDFTHTVKEWGNSLSSQGDFAVWMVVNTPGIGWEVGGQMINGQFVRGGWRMPMIPEEIRVNGSIESLR